MQLTSAGKEPNTNLLSSQGSGHTGKLALSQPLQHLSSSIVGSALPTEDTAQVMCKLPPILSSVASQDCKLIHSPAAQTNSNRLSASTSFGRARPSRPVIADKRAATTGHLSQIKHLHHHVSTARPQPQLTDNHNQLRDQLQINLVAAHAIGYCNGIRQTAAKSSLIFSREATSAGFESSSAINQTQMHSQRSDARQSAAATEGNFAPSVVVTTACVHAQHNRPSIPGQHQEQQQQHHMQQQAPMPPDHQQQRQVGHTQQHRQPPQQLQSPCTNAGLSDNAENQMQSQPAEPVPQCCSGGNPQQKRLVSIAKPAGATPSPHIKFRCDVRDLLDTHFAGWDSSPINEAPASPAHAAAVAASDRPCNSNSISNSQQSRPSKAPMLQSTLSDAASANSAPPDGPPAPHPAVARVPVSHLSVPSALHSTGSSSNLGSDDSASLTEAQARQAMPPPRGRRATAESVQAAVAAAQQEDWAMAAHVAAWGTSFPGIVPFARLGAAAWNIGFPQQVAEVMTCTGTRRFPKPIPFIPPTFGAPVAGPPALHPPSASTLTSCSSNASNTDLLCKTASLSTVESADASAAGQLPSFGPLFSQYPCNAVLPGPQPWGVSKRPYVLSSLPHVMQQLMEESSTDFLHSWTLAHLPNQAADPPAQQLPAKKQRQDRQPEAAVGQTSQTGISQRQSADETANSGLQQSATDRQAEAVQTAREGASVDQITGSNFPHQRNPMREAEAKLTPLQMMKQRARRRVAEAIAPRASHSSSMSLK